MVMVIVGLGGDLLISNNSNSCRIVPPRRELWRLRGMRPEARVAVDRGLGSGRRGAEMPARPSPRRTGITVSTARPMPPIRPRCGPRTAPARATRGSPRRGWRRSTLRRWPRTRRPRPSRRRARATRYRGGTRILGANGLRIARPDLGPPEYVGQVSQAHRLNDWLSHTVRPYLLLDGARHRR